MRIEASGYKLEFPQACACCGCSADTAVTVSASKSSGRKVVRTKTNTWDFPYCRRCVKHVRIMRIARIVALTTAAAALIAGGIYYLRIAPRLGILLAITGVSASILIFVSLKAYAVSVMKVNCVCVGAAVRFLDWHGTQQAFEIVSPQYALGFMMANQRKLINLSPEARHLFEGAGYEHRAKGTQSAKRYRE